MLKKLRYLTKGVGRNITEDIYVKLLHEVLYGDET